LRIDELISRAIFGTQRCADVLLPLPQADVARAIRAAKQVGAAEVEVRIGEQSSIVIRLNSSTAGENAIETTGEIVL
jgi:hypothetical protein